MAQVPPTRALADAGQIVGDGSACVVGKFCASSNPDQGCGTITLETTIKLVMRPGNLLIIFDQSQSMSEKWMSTTKLQAARDALVAAIMPLQDSLHVGAIFLPDPNVSCIFQDPQMTPAVQPIEGAGNIPFQAGPQFLTAFNNHWSMQGAGKGIGTPLNEAFDRADVALQAAMTALKSMTMSPVGDLAPGPIAVLVFTDGQPNCPPLQGGGMMGASSPLPAVTGIPTKLEPQHAADWFAQGVPTYMVGLQGAMDGATLLNAIASSGSGGMMTMFISPTDPMALSTKLTELVQLQVMQGLDSCSIDLMPATSTPDKLQLVVEEASMPGVQENVPHDLGAAGGWTITPDGSHVELTGGVCDSAKSGTFSKLTFTYGCKDIPPIPPNHIS
jgi:hypothetical protein